jgi:endonuclease-3
MFYSLQVQSCFAFSGHDDIARWHRLLAPLRRSADPLPRRSPVGQLVKSMISGRTRDAVSQAAYQRLTGALRSPGRIARASPRHVRTLIWDVTFAADKADHLVAALRRIERERGGYALDFLGALPLGDALAWLERLPGVGRKVSASTLNASTLARPVLIVDSHVVRVLRRLGLVAHHAEPREASEAVTAAMLEWDSAAFLDFHVAAKLLGQTLCRPEHPDCGACPLARECRHARH